jgi:hypothetical protein
MGIALDTNEVCEYVLTLDKDKPERPTFLLRYVSYRDANRIAKLFDESDSATDSELAYNKALEGIKIALVGWRNVGIDYKPEDLDAVVTMSDIAEIRVMLLATIGNSESDKKKAKLQSKSSTAKSANVTEPTASAETVQPITQ